MLDITLYGKQTSSYAWLKYNVSKVADNAGLAFSLKEINEVEMFIEDQIYKIPAISIGGELIIQGNSDLNEYVLLCNKKILQAENQTDMIQIVVPTDMSQTADNALEYALEIAKTFNASVRLLHVYRPVPITANGITYIDPNIEANQKKKFDDYTQSINDRSLGDIYIENDFVVGLTKTEILSYARNIPSAMIIMGSHGQTGLFKKIFGSVSIDMVKSSDISLFIIPPDYKFSGVQNVAFAIEDNESNYQHMNKVLSWADKIDVKLNLVHIQTAESKKPSQIPTIPEAFQELDIGLDVVKSTNIYEGLLNYCNEVQADLLILTKKKKGFIESLFNKSATRAMAMHPQVPLLIIE
jgi:nucleotide-binding universal stress UspA family protein